VAEPEWHRANRDSWDQFVDLHLGPHSYDLTDLRAGSAQLGPIEAGELSAIEGKRIVHLQCHFGADSLRLAQRRAQVVGLDFSSRAIEVARSLADEFGLAGRAQFVEADTSTMPCAQSLRPMGSTLHLSPGAPFAGYRTSRNGRKSSRLCYAPAGRSI